jgi:hypothetical protein
MNWQSKTDLGLEIVGQIHDTIKITDHWRTDFARGFTWWADEFAQRVWADNSMFSNAQSFFRIHVETDLLMGRGKAHQFELALATEMSHATMSAVCFDAEKDKYILHSSAYFTHDNLEWLQTVFVGGAFLQVAEAHAIGHDLARKLNAVPAVSEHPIHGMRNPPDPVLGAINSFFKPHGAQPSKWTDNGEWQGLGWAMDRQADRFDSDRRTLCTAQFPWFLDASTPIQMVISSEDAHPVLGNGLRLRLLVPLALPPERCAHTAMELNNLERKEWLRAHMMGSWGFEDNKLEYEAFIPNTLYHADILENLALSMAIRAQWVNEQFGRWFNQAG